MTSAIQWPSCAITASTFSGLVEANYNNKPGVFIMRAMRHIASLAVLFCSTALSQAGTLSRHSLDSAVLDREYPYSVYLPDDYDISGLSYPVLYLLHGSNGSEMSWANSGKIKATADRLIAEGKINPLIIIMPGHNESWWADGKDEAAQTALLKDLFPHVEKNYRTIAERGGRAVSGLSAGGFGTVNLILQFPEMFAVGAALSPAVYTPVPPAHSSAYRHKVFQTEGTLDPAVWAQLNWPSFIDSYKQKNLIVPLYINSGDHDTFDIAYHAANFYQVMRENQPNAVEYRVVDGDHEWSVWEQTIGDAILFMDRHLAAPR
jgi:enterochelin esterase-like enzyme